MSADGRILSGACPPGSSRSYSWGLPVAWGAELGRPARPIRRLEAFPEIVLLTGPAATQHLVVIGIGADGSSRDLTTEAKLVSESPDVVRIDGDGTIRPVVDGRAKVAVRYGSARMLVPVEIKDASRPRRVSFRNDVVPALTKLGCNQGACHGSQHGKGGFKLSLLGFEPEADYVAIVKSAGGRRALPYDPEQSLLLLKPTLSVAHGGGKRLEAGSRGYELLMSWLEDGAPSPSADDPKVTGLKVYPAHRVMTGGEEQRLVVMAALDDGSERDVSEDARFDTLNEAVAAVRPSGVVRTVGRGEANVMVRYQGRAAMARVTVPFGPERRFEFASSNIVDQKAAAKWRDLGLVPSPACTDAEFLRRAMLDAIGTTPTPDEVDDFLDDPDPAKRTKLGRPPARTPGICRLLDAQVG